MVDLNKLQSSPLTLLNDAAYLSEGYITNTQLNSTRDMLRITCEVVFIEERVPEINTLAAAKRILYGLIRIAEKQNDLKAISEIEGALTLLEL